MPSWFISASLTGYIMIYHDIIYLLLQVFFHSYAMLFLMTTRSIRQFMSESGTLKPTIDQVVRRVQ